MPLESHNGKDAERAEEGPLCAPDSSDHPDLRRILLIALLVVGAYLLLPQLAGVGRALRILEQISPPYIAGALAFQAISVLSHAQVVQQTLEIFGSSVRFLTVLEISLASSFATLFVPSVGLSGLALRCRYLGERGFSLEATGVAFTIEAVGQAAAHAAMVTIAFAYRSAQGRQPPWTFLALVLSVLLLTAASLVLLLAKPARRDWRYRILHGVNRLRRRQDRPPIDEATLEHRLTDLRRSVAAVGTDAGLRLMLGNIGRNLAAALALYLTLLALNQRVPLSAVVLSYSLSDVLGGLSSLPAGLLVTETSLSALLNRAGAPLAMAVAATLVSRLITVWLPRGLGLVAWIDLQRRSKRPLWW